MLNAADRRGWARLVCALMLALLLGACEEILPKRTPGEKLYSKHCSKCHGGDGAGETIKTMGQSYSNLLDNSWRYAGDAPGMQSVLSQDLVFDHPTFSQRLSREEIKQVTDHVIFLRGETRD
jgi:mono/diheme cytochrome c family protein